MDRKLEERPYGAAEVIDVFGYALYLAQTGAKHAQAKPLAAKRAKELEDEQT